MCTAHLGFALKCHRTVKALLNHGANKKLMSKGFSSHLEIAALDVAKMKLRREKSQEKIRDYEEVIDLLK